jgi:hypothetical protein
LAQNQSPLTQSPYNRNVTHEDTQGSKSADQLQPPSDSEANDRGPNSQWNSGLDRTGPDNIQPNNSQPAEASTQAPADKERWQETNKLLVGIGNTLEHIIKVLVASQNSMAKVSGSGLFGITFVNLVDRA